MTNSIMTISQYQAKAMTTCMPSCDNISYMLLGLAGEMGELCGKMAKHIRHEDAVISQNKLLHDLSEQQIHDLRSEVGDCAWMLAGLCHTMGWQLEEICKENIKKLADRKLRGVIDGSGDNR